MNRAQFQLEMQCFHVFPFYDYDYFVMFHKVVIVFGKAHGLVNSGS